MITAFTRAVSPRLADCALTHLIRSPIDPARASLQHAAYEAALAGAGCRIVRLPDLPDHPDGVFVEDTAILLGDDAIITRPGAPSRAEEADSTATGLDTHVRVHRLAAGTLDGGDVLRIERTIYVGLSSRTDAAGAAALAELAAPLGYRLVIVEPARCLHLKTAVTFAGRDRSGRPTILVNPDWVDPGLFEGVHALEVAEPSAANCVRVGDTLILPRGNPRTAERLAACGFNLAEVDVSELQKAEAGVTCMSLVRES
ncbi:MAG: dimethylarginine dimethylaminohydrolase [Sphingomicrobium sp.]